MLAARRKIRLVDRRRYERYVRALGPLLWLALRETTGSVAFNRGSAGSVLDGAILGTTSLSQPGLIGPREAFLFDGATSVIEVNNHASIQGAADFTLWMLLKPGSAGEADGGRLFYKLGEIDVYFNDAARHVRAVMNYDTTGGIRQTSTTVGVGGWHSLGVTLDAVTRTPRIFIDGAEASYDQTIVGSNSTRSRTIDGLVDEVLWISRALSDSQLRLLHHLAGPG
jgi:hypothetical protein